MGKILVSGLLNLETTAKIRGFPINYYPIDFDFFGVNSTLSGVAFNLAKALTTLGDTVDLTSLVGRDLTARMFIEEIGKMRIRNDLIQQKMNETPSSVVLYDESGRRQIYCDLKDIQETSCDFSEQIVDEADAVAACNINFSRPLLEMAKSKNKLIATDVHVLSNIDDDYNKQFMEYADILFLSDENIPYSKHDFIRNLGARYHNSVIILGMGASPVVEVYLVLVGFVVAVAYVDGVRRDHPIEEFRALPVLRVPLRPQVRRKQVRHRQRHYTRFLSWMV